MELILNSLVTCTFDDSSDNRPCANTTYPNTCLKIEQLSYMYIILMILKITEPVLTLPPLIPV